MYHIAQNTGNSKLWRIWQFTTNLPKIIILADLQCKVTNPPMFFANNDFVQLNKLQYSMD